MNMSYCRFENTRADLTVCLNSILRDDRLSESEVSAGKAMFREFLAFCRDYDIIDGYDSETLNELFEGLQKKEGIK